MRRVQIQEFSLSTAVDYRQAVPFAEAKLEDVAKFLAGPPCGDFLNPTEIVMGKQNELFSYSLAVPLFNGAANILINSQGITISFKQGKTNEHLELMIKLTLATLEAARVGHVKRSVLSFTGHATFEQPSQFSEQMKRFTELSPSIVSGGLVLVSQIPEIGGDLRYASEKSLGYSDALFIAASSVSQADVTLDLFKTIRQKFEDIAALDGIVFEKS